MAKIFSRWSYKANPKGNLIFTRLAAPFGMWETHSGQPFAQTPDAMVALSAAWQHGATADKPIPRALDFTPVALRGAASSLALVDLRQGLAPARYLWAGSHLVSLFGGPLIGKRLNECYGGQTLREVREAYQRMIDARGPVFSDRRFRVFRKKLGDHRLLLPLLDERGEIGLALLMLIPKGQLRAAVDWRVLELELDLVRTLTGTSSESHPYGSGDSPKP